MKYTDLIKGNRYRCTCFNNNYCTFVDTHEVIQQSGALVTVNYRGRLYLVADTDLF